MVLSALGMVSNAQQGLHERGMPLIVGAHFALDPDHSFGLVMRALEICDACIGARPLVVEYMRGS